jgi:predicted AAA+ superfamily ATPase
MFKRWMNPPNANYILLGPRRAGKTTFLKSVYPDFEYISLDDFDYLTLAEEDPKAVVQGKKNLIIDEIQRVPKLTIAVKHVIDEFGANIIMTGSSRIGLLDSSADTLAGRIQFCHMPTTCWGESEGAPSHSIFEEEASPLQIKQANRELNSFISYGGFPEVTQLRSELEKSQKLKDYKNTYFTIDLSLISNIENISALLAILNHYALSIGSLTNISNFSRESGVSHPTAQKYINVIYQSDLGFKLLGYQYGPAKRHIKSTKSYFADTGIIHSLGVSCSEGQLFENFIVSELEKRRKLGFIKSEQFYYYQTVGGAEIDLIFDIGNITYAVEIKATKFPTKKDIKNLKSFVDEAPKNRIGFLFYKGEKYMQIDDIKCIPAAAIYRGI